MTITTAPNPCWTLVDAEGREYEPEGVAHYLTREAAIEERNRHVKSSTWLAPLHGYEPRQLTEACTFVTCDGCDYTFDEDDQLNHFGDEAEAQSVAADSGWTFTGGQVRCGTDCEGMPLVAAMAGAAPGSAE